LEQSQKEAVSALALPFTTPIVIPNLSLAGISPLAEGEETAPPRKDVHVCAAV